MKAVFDALQRSVTGKVLFIGFLVLLLLIPIGMVRGLALERAQRYDAARNEIANAWGAAQIIGGPILIVPFRYTRMVNAAPLRVLDELYLLPDELGFTGTVNVEERARGIYRIPVYTARLGIGGRFAAPDIDAGYDGLEILWDQAQIALPLADPRSIREPVELVVGNARAPFRPGGERVAGFGPQLVARYADLGLERFDAGQAFFFDLVIGGTGRLSFLPLGAVTTADLRSTWRSPSFGGAHLPANWDWTPGGFTAQWRVLDLGRGYPAAFRKSSPPPLSVAASAFGVDLITPIGVHAATLRALKHAVLLLGLTFGAYFLFEIFAALRLHTLHYLLIGSANCLFYLLLLALAEHFGFGPAYAASAAASIALIGTYSKAVLRTARRALPVVGLLTALYTYLYVTLQAEDYALLLGALGLFAMLAVLMYVTRRIDWHAVIVAPRNVANAKAPESPPAPAM